jgi:hypothetical protein
MHQPPCYALTTHSITPYPIGHTIIGQEFTQGAQRLVRDSVAPTTATQYESVWPRWRLFLHTLFNIPAAPATPDAIFIPFQPDPDIARLVAMFSCYLFNTVNLNADRVIQQLSALKYQFAIRDGPVNAWSSDHLALVRRGLSHQPIPPGQESHRRLPVTLEMVLYIYNNYNTSHLVYRRARAAAIILSFCCLLRPSEYLWGTRTNTHVLTARQVEFECSTPGTSNTVFISLAGIHTISWDRVVLMRINMTSAKNINRRTGSRLWFSSTDRSALHVVRVMYDWEKYVQAYDPAPVFSWPAPHTSHHRSSHYTHIPTPRINLLYREFHEVIRAAAAHFGFDHKQFGCQGLRVGGATLLRAARADDGFICLMGRWKSLPACPGYQEVSTQAHDRMAEILLTPDIYTTRDLALQYCLPQHTVA